MLRVYALGLRDDFCKNRMLLNPSTLKNASGASGNFECLKGVVGILSNTGISLPELAQTSPRC